MYVSSSPRGKGCTCLLILRKGAYPYLLVNDPPPSHDANVIEPVRTILFRLVSTELLKGDFTLVPTPRETLNWLKEPS